MKNIILDLDNTIICSVEKNYYDKTTFSLLDENLEHYDMENLYRIYKRPNLDEFLDYAFKNFKVSVFTAATKDYALFIIDKFILQGKPERKLEFMFHSYHVEISELKYNYYKDLRLLWNILPSVFSPSNTVIIDDLEQVKKANKQNCISVKGFEVFDENKKSIITSAIKDTELNKVINVLRLYTN